MAVLNMGVLDRKLLRDLWRLRGQVFAVAMVIASGVALLVMSLSTVSSLRATTDAYYERYRFADVFAAATRAPERLAARIAAIEGVRGVETRVVALSTVDLPGVAAPVTVQLVSVPEGREPVLNRLVIRSGRGVEPGRDEVVVHEPFAEANGLRVGGRLSVLMNGVRREVRIAGIGLSPEYVYSIAPGGLMPDDAHFGILWMGREALAAAYDLDGAFNSLSLSLLRGADADAVIGQLDPILADYGGTGAVARKDQISNWFLMNELEQLRTMATILPTIFLTVASFLSYTVLTRLIATERREISLMKAFGYTNLEVGWHYLKLSLVMAAVGIVLGWGIGAVLGWFNTAQYNAFFRFPFLFYRPTGGEFVLSGGIALAVAAAGSFWAVRSAVMLPPAEAMRPPAPEMFRTAALPEGFARRLDNQTRIILRQIARAPLRSGLTVTGVALAVGVLTTALQWPGIIDAMIASHFHGSQKQDVTVGFHQVQGHEAAYALARLPGVRAVEPMRIVSAELSNGHRRHRGGLTGLPEGARLQVVHDVDGTVMPVPRAGVVLGTVLARKLGVVPGDTIDVEVLDRDHPRFRLPVSATVATLIEMPAYVNLDALNREIGDPRVFAFANLMVDSGRMGELYARLKEMPGVSAVMVKEDAVRTMQQTLGETVLIFAGFFVVFSCALAYGVIYNATRIALSERGRELATLRVLGFTRWDISYILLGEAALLALAGLPLGCLAGYGLMAVIVQAFETELFRMPFVLSPSTLGYALVIVLGATVVSAGLVRRRLDHLDLIAVLKTRE